MTEPRGPVYLTLPRETLGETAVSQNRPQRPLGVPPVVASDNVIAEAAHMIAQAEFPLIITSASGRYPGAVEALARLASRFALPVVQNETRDLNLPTDHPMHLGFASSKWLPKADVILAVESVVPWMPKNVRPKPGAKVIRLSSDPLAARYPFRDTDADLLIGGDPVAALVALKDALTEECKSQTAIIERRRQDVEKAHAALAEQRAALIEKARTGSPIHPAWVDHCVNERKAKDAIVISELGLAAANLDLTAPGSYMGNLMSGARGHPLGRRRLLHVRQPAAVPFRGAGRKSASADPHQQQPVVARGAPRDARHLSGWPCSEGECDAVDRVEALARIREGDRGVRWLWRGGERPGKTAGGAGPRVRQGAQRHAGAAQCDFKDEIREMGAAQAPPPRLTLETRSAFQRSP